LLTSLTPWRYPQSVVSVVPDIEKARLYRGKGGELIRHAVCKLIRAISVSRLPLPPQPLNTRTPIQLLFCYSCLRPNRIYTPHTPHARTHHIATLCLCAETTQAEAPQPAGRQSIQDIRNRRAAVKSRALIYTESLNDHIKHPNEDIQRAAALAFTAFHQVIFFSLSLSLCARARVCVCVVLCRVCVCVCRLFC
jgi:hypothetical protein